MSHMVVIHVETFLHCRCDLQSPKLMGWWDILGIVI